MAIVLLIVSFLIASFLVKTVRHLFMKLIGADAMFFNGKTQLIIIVIVTYFVYGFLYDLL